MRILITTDKGPLWDQNIQIAHELGRAGHTVVLAVSGNPDFGQRWQAAAAGAILETGPTEPADFAAWLPQVCARQEPDVVHANDFAHAVWSETPMVLSVHGTQHGRWAALYGDEEPPEELEPYAEQAAAAVEQAALVVTPSQAVLEKLEWYATPERAVIVRPAVAPVFAPSERQAQVLCAAPLWDEAKGIAVLDEATPHTPWPVRAAGPTSGPGGKAVFENLMILGDLPRAQMARELGHAGLFVDPAFYEPVGVMAAKAAARGAPLLLSDIPGRREMWGDAAAYVPPGAPDLLHEAMVELIHDAEARAEMAALSLQHAQAHTAADMVADLIGAYAHCIGQRAVSASHP